MVATQAKKTKRSTSSNDVYPLYAKALESVQKGAYKAALTTIGSIDKKFPSEIEVRSRARQLAAICERRLEGDPDSGAKMTVEELFDRGVYHHNRGEFEQAAGFFSRALKKDAKADFVHYAMAATESRQGNSEEAVQHLTDAVGLNQDNRFYAANDSDFEELKDDEAFSSLVSA